MSAARSYLHHVALAYFMAPSESEEERLLDEALRLACERHGVSDEEIGRQVSCEFADLIDECHEQDADAEPTRGCCGEFETGSGEHTGECTGASS